MKALPFIHQPDRVARKASDVSAADWQYQHTRKNIVFFTCVVMAFLRAGNPCIKTVVYKINPCYMNILSGL